MINFLANDGGALHEVRQILGHRFKGNDVLCLSVYQDVVGGGQCVACRDVAITLTHHPWVLRVRGLKALQVVVLDRFRYFDKL